MNPVYHLFISALLLLFVSVNAQNQQFPQSYGYGPVTPDANRCEKTNVRPTGSDVEGPYYKPGAPFRMGTTGRIPVVCEEGMPGTRFYLNGTVRAITAQQPCGQPVRALLDVWSADMNGDYAGIQPPTPDYVSLPYDSICDFKALFFSRKNFWIIKPLVL